ncbi:MAG: phosphoribosyltransferase [Thermoplasmata archaeon]|uniref:Phosphoribosyltransferase n=1 Tax=Candidatus Sysuiplasma superficiale TaxID=2823368 RepID=A0A8J7YRH1_9ARCH|nr:phosphoribosyltransferase [Candidatus Sysuiplasma superficiale]MBX8643274.1 phosphoribosyltransferase [Candidatus Sysuiplasma superficiale]MCL4347321.1 phosphoribosyltransferase [Candidatus Thermoplasmatota archaeon]
MAKTVPARLVEWKDIAAWCSTLGEKIVSSDFRPDVIVGMARGGWVPSRILCDELVVRGLISVKTQHWGITATRDGRAVLSSNISEDISGCRVLVVDDITDTGESIKLAFDHVRSQGALETRTATMLHINHSNFVPDYYAEEISSDRWTWFVFPWNYYEDMAKFITDIVSEKPSTVAEIRAGLESNNSIRLNERQLISVLIRLSRLGIISRRGKEWGKT